MVTHAAEGKEPPGGGSQVTETWGLWVVMPYARQATS